MLIGKAWPYPTICDKDPSKAIAMVKWDNSINETAQNFAHAVGLILGMYKDEAPASTGRNKICGTEQDNNAKNIMSSSKPKESKWSSCSNEDFQNYYDGVIASGKPFCLEVREKETTRGIPYPESKQNM